MNSDLANSTQEQIPWKIYQIRMQGELSQRWSHWFENLTITLTKNGHTILTGPLTDQAALYGVLKKIRDTGLTLISVNCIENENGDDH